MRRYRALFGVLGIGLMAAALVIYLTLAVVDSNSGRVTELERLRAADRAAAAEQSRLVRALQDQVRRLGGTPATQAPTPAASQPPAGPTRVAPAVSPAPAAQSPSPRPVPRPSATSRPPSSPTPSPTPSPSPPCRVSIGPIRVCP